MAKLSLLLFIAAVNTVTVFGQAIPNQYIVKFKSSANVASMKKWTQMQFAAFGTSQDEVIKTYNINDQFKGMAGKFSSSMVEQIKNNPEVEYVVEDGVAKAYDGQALDSQPGATWGLTRISQRASPDYSKPYQYVASAGEGVTAYIIDTGIKADHPDFEGRAVQAFKSDRNFRDYDDNGHGTHVAGTIGGKTWGVAKKTKLVGVKVLSGGGSGSWSGVIAGINWVAEQVKAAGGKKSVANMSLGGGKNQAVNDAVEAAVAAGVNFAVAAGNEDQDACDVSPASSKGILTVAASDKNDARASFSNWGAECVDLFAPGVGITSAWNNGRTNTISGTSMASPHVCGVLALFLGENPDLTPAQLKNKIVSATTADVVSDVNGTPNKLLFNAL